MPQKSLNHQKEEQIILNIRLRCIGVGHPPPLVQWRKVNGSLSDRVSTTNVSMITNEGNVTRVTVDLIITSGSREDTGVYECSANNPLNIAKRDNSLIIQCMQAINMILSNYKLAKM